MAREKIETHEMVWLKAKPSPDQITAMVNRYFESEAAHYDEFDHQSEKREKYTQTVNRCVAEDLPRR